MTIVALAESYHEHPEAAGTFPIPGNRLPGGWGPAPQNIAAPAFPTPFARAEAMRQVLAAIDATEAGATSEHDYAKYFGHLLVGTAAGILEPRVIDLDNTARYDNFGQALRRASPEARYIVELAEVDPQQPRGRGLVYGYSHPDCLFWPHARRQGAEWTRLRSRLGAREAESLALLREWQEALTRGGLWNDNELLPWQRGVAFMLKGASLDPKLTRLHEDCRFTGPIVLRARGADGKLYTTPVYFPARRDGFAGQFIRRCDLQPTLQTNSIALAEGVSVHVRIALPEPEFNAGRVELGSGIVDLIDAGPLPPPSQSYCFEDQKDSQGLPRLLSSVVQALGNLEPARRVDRKAVEKCPVLYPDPVRVLVHRNLWRDAATSDAIATAHCERRMIRAAGDRGPRFPSVDDEGEGLIVALFGEDSVAQRRMLFVERFEGLAISDLSALGSCLYLAFIGEAKVVGADLRDSEERSLLASTASRPLEASAAAHERLDSERPRARKRLATLQRFVASYGGAKPPANRSGLGLSLPELLSLAACTFANSATEMGVIASGQRAKTGSTYELVNGQKLVLLADALENGGG